MPLAAGTYTSVFKYQLELKPFVAGNDVWLAEPGGADTLSGQGATLAVETLRTAGAQQFVDGDNRLGFLRFEPEILQEQVGNVVDADAAEPIFRGLVRKACPPLPDVAALKKASQWNHKMHPKESGISLAELRARLEQYIDRPALDELVRQANAGAVNPSYGSDEATTVTLLADQFQRKTCRNPTVGETWMPPTMGGMVAEDTLDALGFVYHLGKKPDFNLADLENKTAAETLKKVRATEFKDLEPGLTAKTWWTYMVRPPWLGMPIKQGIHLVLLKRLRQAQQFLMGLRAYENMSPAELGKVLGLEEEHKGARPWTATKRCTHSALASILELRITPGFQIRR
ncbi:MAG: hypothetical protein ACRDFW_06755 [bacterium]